MVGKVRTGFGKFGKLWKLKMPSSRAWKVLGKGGFSKWLWISFGFLTGKF